MEITQPKSVKVKIIGYELRSGMNWQGTLKQRGGTNGHEMRPGCIMLCLTVKLFAKDECVRSCCD
jgi:hypothetical protein